MGVGYQLGGSSKNQLRRIRRAEDQVQSTVSRWDSRKMVVWVQEGQVGLHW